MTTMTMEALSKQLSKIDFCMFSTNGELGRISSRPMSNNGDVEYDGDSWFFTYEDTEKIREIGRHSGVSLTFTASPSLLGRPGIFIAVDGDATLVRDKTQYEKHWAKDLDRWFPDGIDTPGILLIKITARSIEYWDGGENGRVDIPATSGNAGGTA
jgi:general stress protein 26